MRRRSSRSADLLLQPRHQALVVDPVEKFLQVQIHHPLVAFFQMPLGLGDRRVTAATGPKAVATRVKRRLVVRAEHFVHRLLHDSIDHIRDAKASLPAARLRNPHAADVPRSVAAVEQLAAQHQQDLVELLAHLVDALPVRTRRALVRRDLLERFSQILLTCHLLHRHRRQCPLLSCSATSAPRAVQTRTGPYPFRRRPLAGCRLSRQTFQVGLPVRWPWSPSLPGAARRLGPPFDGLSVLRDHPTSLVPSPCRLSFFTATGSRSEAERSPRVRTQNFVQIPSPLLVLLRRISGFAVLRQLTQETRLTALRFRSVPHCTSGFHRRPLAVAATRVSRDASHTVLSRSRPCLW